MGQKRLLLKRGTARSAKDDRAKAEGVFPASPDSERTRRDGHRIDDAMIRFLNQIPVLILGWNVAGEIIFWNRSCEWLTGFTQKEINEAIIGTSAENIASCPSEGRHHGKIMLPSRDGGNRLVMWDEITHLIPGYLENRWVIGSDITNRDNTHSRAGRISLAESHESEVNDDVETVEMKGNTCDRSRDSEKILESQLLTNINMYVIPLMERLKTRADINEKDYIDLIISSLKAITNYMLPAETAHGHCLTPREVEISQLVKRGLSSKEIGTIVNCSEATVRKHRRNVRKKLGITGLQKNLVVYLNQ